MGKSGLCPSEVRYIKLGKKGGWEKECLSKGIIRFGFDSATAERFPLCQKGQWEKLTRSFLDAGKDKGTATRFTKETRLFFTDVGSTLWITFVGQHLCWGQLTPDPPQRHDDKDGVWRTVVGGWRRVDLNGEPLTKDRLSGALTKLAAYRGTSCRVDVSDYVIRRINGYKSPEVERAIDATETMKASIIEMMKMLGPQDFELLVELVFSSSGWRRLGKTGGPQKTLDLDLQLPSTNERAFVQVKCHTNSDELTKYARRLDELDMYDKMFFVHHSGSAKIDDERVKVIGPSELSELVLGAGLVNWLIRKVS